MVFEILFYGIYFAVIYTFPKSSPSVVEKNCARVAHEKRALFYCFISLTKTMSVSIYKQLNSKMDFKQITYFSDINWQKLATRGVYVLARDIMFALWSFTFWWRCRASAQKKILQLCQTFPFPKFSVRINTIGLIHWTKIPESNFFWVPLNSHSTLMSCIEKPIMCWNISVFACSHHPPNKARVRLDRKPSPLHWWRCSTDKAVKTPFVSPNSSKGLGRPGMISLSHRDWRLLDTASVSVWRYFNFKSVLNV